MNQPDDHLDDLFVIPDLSLDREEILRRIRRAMQHRRAAGGYGPDVTALGPTALHPEAGAGDAVDPDRFIVLQTAADELAFRSRLQEPEFRSQVPLLGPLIVRVRRLWNWMSTRWYVLGWMRQQVDFNVRVAELLEELIQTLEENERRLRELEARLADKEEGKEGW